MMIEPIDATFEELIIACVKPTFEPDPSLRRIKKVKKEPSKAKKKVSLAYEVAEKMWLADDRPCSWSELTPSEKSEWAVMARAAIAHIKGLLS